MLMDQSSRDNTLVGVRPPPVAPEDAVSLSPRGTSERSVPSEVPMTKEGSAISSLTSLWADS